VLRVPTRAITMGRGRSAAREILLATGASKPTRLPWCEGPLTTQVPASLQLHP
jgi:hypothetical protein